MLSGVFLTCFSVMDIGYLLEKVVYITQRDSLASPTSSGMNGSQVMIKA